MKLISQIRVRQWAEIPLHLRKRLVDLLLFSSEVETSSLSLLVLKWLEHGIASEEGKPSCTILLLFSLLRLKWRRRWVVLSHVRPFCTALLLFSLLRLKWRRRWVVLSHIMWIGRSSWKVIPNYSITHLLTLKLSSRKVSLFLLIHIFFIHGLRVHCIHPLIMHLFVFVELCCVFFRLLLHPPKSGLICSSLSRLGWIILLTRRFIFFIFLIWLLFLLLSLPSRWSTFRRSSSSLRALLRLQLRRIVGPILSINIDILLAALIIIIVLFAVVGRWDLQNIIHLVVEVYHICIVLRIKRSAEDIPRSINLKDIEADIELSSFLFCTSGLRLHELSVLGWEFANSAVDAEFQLANGQGITGGLLGDETDNEERFFNFLSGLVSCEILSDHLSCGEPLEPL